MRLPTLILALGWPSVSVGEEVAGRTWLIRMLRGHIPQRGFNT